MNFLVRKYKYKYICWYTWIMNILKTATTAITITAATITATELIM